MIDLEKITAESLTGLFRKGPTKGQLQGVKDICWKLNQDPTLKDLRWLAYMLGTTIHETSSTMEPIEERGGAAYFESKYDPVLASTPERRATAVKYGNTEEGEGVRYRGRGYVQITWKSNYERFGKELKLDLIKKPELALKKSVALSIMFIGMKKGMFTGRKLDQYFNFKKEDWIGARGIINGNDAAERIANYSKMFLEVLIKVAV